MPAALERKLKHEVSGKKMSKERKDAYVYGTLRKTGWKPKREREKELSAKLDGLIEFSRGQRAVPLLDNIMGGIYGTGLKTYPFRDVYTDAARRKAVTAPHQLREQNEARDLVADILKKNRKSVRNPDYKLSSELDDIIQFGALSSLMEKLGQGAAKVGESAGTEGAQAAKQVTLRSSNAASQAGANLTPWNKMPWKTGSGGNLSPYSLGDQYAGLSANLDRLIQFSGGYINTDEGVKKERGIGAHFNRATGRYIGGTLLFPVGALPGWGVDSLRAKHNIQKTKYESEGPPWLAKGPKLMSSKTKPIQFGAEILGPWSGPTGHTSKIDQLEFPAGLAPVSALQMPFPQLMAYLNQRNILQQTF